MENRKKNLFQIRISWPYLHRVFECGGFKSDLRFELKLTHLCVLAIIFYQFLVNPTVSTVYNIW